MLHKLNENELYHHGIKGQKWGIRRFQNEDGSLTEAGKERYGGQTDYSRKAGLVKTALRDIATGNFDHGIREYKEKRVEKLGRKERIYEDQASMAKSEKRKEKYLEKAQKVKEKKEAQKAANDNRSAYDRHTSTGKLWAQNILFAGYGAEKYRDARARGATRGRAVVEGMFAYTLPGIMLSRAGNKKAYGTAVHQDIENGEEL